MADKIITISNLQRYDELIKKYIDDLGNTKLDKITSTADYDRVYAISSAGAQVTRNIDLNATGNSIVKRDDAGHVVAADPTSTYHATTKKYVDDCLALKPSLLGDGTAIVSDADLNTVDYYKVGNYQCSSDSIATTLTNSPTKCEFLMEVSTIKNTYNNEAQNTSIFRIRKITDYMGNCFIQYVTKTAVDGVYTWRTSAWEQMATRSYIDDMVGNIEALLEAI